MIIRPEIPHDRDAIRHLHEAAFETPAEAGLVDRLRADGDAVIGLVALADGQIAGHVMFSRMKAPFPALGLAPVSVDSRLRRQGIAARLIQTGLDIARDQSWRGVFVLGDPDYYGRFGFRPETAAGFDSPYAGPWFMAMTLGGGAPVNGGRADYAPAFAALA